MIRTSLFALLFIFSSAVLAQRDTYVSFEALGSGGFGSFNYERDLLTKGPLDLQFRGGFSFLPVDKNNGTTLIFPTMAHFVIGQKTSRLDAGLGIANSITTRGAFWFRFPLSLGYRLEPQERNFYLRFSYTPILSLLFDQQIEHWGGITFGYKIKRKKGE